MSWLFLAIIARFLWAASSAVDQLISRAHKQEALAAGAILYLCMLLPFSGFCFLLSDGPFDPNPVFLGWIMLGAVMNVIALNLFYKCLQTDDAHSIMAFLEFTPVFLVMLAYFVYGETMTPLQLLGGAIVILCGFAFSWDFKHGHVRIATFVMMGMAAFLYAVYQLSMKSAAMHMDFWGTTGSFLLAESLFGWAGFALHRKARASIVQTARETKGMTVFIAALSTFFAVVGIAAVIAAFQQAPTAGHVAALGPTQPFFSFLIAGVLGIVLHKSYQKVVLDRDTVIKLSLIIGIAGGIYLLVRG